jgi:hypothetical protein
MITETFFLFDLLMIELIFLAFIYFEANGL